MRPEQFNKINIVYSIAIITLIGLPRYLESRIHNLGPKSQLRTYNEDWFPDCGLTYDDVKTSRLRNSATRRYRRMVAYDNTTRLSYPSIVFLSIFRTSYLVSSKKDWSCIGVLISPNMVLTAAHCLRQIDLQNGAIEVHTEDGLYNLKVHLSKGAQLAEQYCLDPCFDLSTFPPLVTGSLKDFGLVKLKSHYEFNETINAVCMPKERLFKKNNVQFHLVAHDRRKKPVMQFLRLKLVDCDPIFVDDPMGASVICFKPEKTGGPCHGDSGAPIYATVDGKQTLFGIATYSMHENCYGHQSDIIMATDVFDVVHRVARLGQKMLNGEGCLEDCIIE